MENKMDMLLERTKSGTPCLWESGGGFTNTGNVTLIGDYKGNCKLPIFIKTHGDLACGSHALIPIKAGDTVLTLYRHHDAVSIAVYRIETVGKDSASLIRTDDPICANFIDAAIRKSYDYHCRTAYYIKEREVQ